MSRRAELSVVSCRDNMAMEHGFNRVYANGTYIHLQVTSHFRHPCTSSASQGGSMSFHVKAGIVHQLGMHPHGLEARTTSLPLDGS